MPLTKRARRRLTILVIGFGILVIVLGVFRFVQLRIRDENALVAKTDGLAAVEDQDWTTALSKLSLAASRYPSDVEVLLGLGRARMEVPTGFLGQNLLSARKLFVRALEILDQKPDPDVESVARCLESLAELTAFQKNELATGELKKLAQRLWALESYGDAAIPYLMLVSERSGRWLPDDPVLVVRGAGTDAEWLDRLRTQDDQSLLRWSLEALRNDPSDFEMQAEVIRALRLGRSDEVQQAGLGEIRESITELIEGQHSIGGEPSEIGYLFLAEEALRLGDGEEAQRLLAEISDIDSMESASLLRLVRMLDAVAARETRLRVVEILQSQADRIASDPILAVPLALRYWLQGDPVSAQDLIQSTRVQAGPEGLEVAIAELILGLVSDIEDSQAVKARFDEYTTSIDPNSPERRVLQQIQGLVTECLRSPIDLDALRAAGERLGGGESGRLIQVMIGDALMRASLPGLAARAYAGVIEELPRGEIPVRRRLIRALLEAEELDAAFLSAFDFARESQSIIAISSFVTTWRLLEEAGVEPRDIQPQFDIAANRSDFVRELIDSLPSESMARLVLLPELIYAMNSSGQAEEVSELVAEIVVQSEDFDSVVRVLRAMPVELDDADTVIARLEDLAESEAEQKLLEGLVYSRQIRSGNSKEALEVFRARYASEPDSASARIELEDAIILAVQNSDLALSGDDRAFLMESSSLATFQRLFNLGIVRDDREMALASLEGMLRLMPPGAPPAVKAEIRFFLRFDRDNDEACRALIAKADQLVTNGADDKQFRSLFPRLLISAPMPETDIAIEVLSLLRSDKMAKAEDLALLARLLESKGRFSEAQEVLDQIQAKGGDDFGVPSLRTQSRLAASRGDFRLMLEVLEEIASKTALPLDRLAYARALSRHGDAQRYESEMQKLMAMEDRPASVDFERASALARAGGISAALDVIAAAPGLVDEDARGLATAQILLVANQREQAKSILENLEGNDQGSLLLVEILIRESEPQWEVIDAILRQLEANETLPAGILRRVATIRLAQPVLRDDLRELRGRISETDPVLSEVLLLASEAISPSGEFEPSFETLNQARQLVQRQDEAVEACLLALNLHERFLETAIPEADLDEIVVAEDYLQDLLELMVSRFPNQLSAYRSLVNHFWKTGEVGSGRNAAYEAMKRSGLTPSLASTVTLARFEILLERYEDVIELLAPRRNGLVQLGRQGNHLGSALLIRALIEQKRYVEAKALVAELAPDDREVDPLVEILRIAAQGSSDSACALVRAAMLEESASYEALETALECMATIYSRTLDAQAEALGRELAERLYRDLPSGSANEIRIGIMMSQFQDGGPSPAFLDACVDLIQSLPDEVAAVIRGRTSDSSTIDPTLLGPLVALTNNFAASFGELASTLPPEERRQYCELASEVIPWLEEIAGSINEVQDSMASSALACGDNVRAERLIELALKSAPWNGRFLYTKARILAAQGRIEEALVAAEVGRWLVNREITAGPADLESFDVLISQLRGSQGS